MLDLAGLDHSGQVALLRRPHRRAVRSQGDGRLHLHAEAAPPGGRQDPRALDRPVQPGHPAAAGRQGAVRRPALRRNGGVGARSLRRRLHAAGDADGEVGRRRRPHQGVRGDRARRRHVRGRHSGNRSTCWSRRCARSASTSTCTIPSRARRPSGARRPSSHAMPGAASGAAPMPRPTTDGRHGNRQRCRRHLSPLAVGQGDGDEPRSDESLQPAGAGSGLRPDPDLDREPGEDSVVVLRRDQEAGDDQLPHLQAGARRAVLRAHLRADQGLRVLVRQVQAHEVQGHHLREVRRRGDALARAARAHGPYRARRAGRAHLVPEVAAEPHRPAARHDAQGPRAHPLFRILRRDRAGPDPAQGPPAPVRGRVSSRRRTSTARTASPP